MSGKLFIISAPSGTGKTSLLEIVMSEVERLVFSVSHTTRQPREGERDGQEYYFVAKEEFQQMIAAGEFLEWAMVHDNYYGTALSPLSHQLEQNRDVLLDIDVQGAEIIRRDGRLPACHIFIAPPDMAELERRLRGRATEEEQTIQKRMQNAHSEMAHCEEYDYFIINDNLQRAAGLVSSIIYAERARSRRTAQGLPVDVGMIR
jgi:guanylate kinase